MERSKVTSEAPEGFYPLVLEVLPIKGQDSALRRKESELVQSGRRKLAQLDPTYIEIF